MANGELELGRNPFAALYSDDEEQQPKEEGRRGGRGGRGGSGAGGRVHGRQDTLGPKEEGGRGGRGGRGGSGAVGRGRGRDRHDITVEQAPVVETNLDGWKTVTKKVRQKKNPVLPIENNFKYNDGCGRRGGGFRTGGMERGGGVRTGGMERGGRGRNGRATQQQVGSNSGESEAAPPVFTDTDFPSLC